MLLLKLLWCRLLRALPFSTAPEPTTQRARLNMAVPMKAMNVMKKKAATKAPAMTAMKVMKKKAARMMFG